MIQRGNTVLDEPMRELHCGGRRAHITLHTSRVLGALMQSPRVMGHGQLLDVLWDGRDDGPQPDEVKTFVCKARKLLREIDADIWIKTVWGSGYMVVEPPA